MRYQGLTFPLFALLAITVVFFNSSHSGGNLTGACSSCHGGNTSANGSIILTGLPNSGSVGLSTTYSMEVCIVDPGKLAAGYRVETDLGTFTDVDGESQTNGANDRITHTFAKPFGSPGNPACWDFNWTSPSSGGPDPTFTLRGNAVNGNSSTTGDNGGYMETSQGLPVEFASFVVKKNGKNVDVNWVTASEINNDRFIIQRSTNNVLFTNITSVDGNDNSLELNSYYFQDIAPPTGTLYYRILQIDNDGSRDYSNTRVIQNEDKSQRWVAYPNPIDLNSTNKINIDNVSTDLSLLDRSGRLLKTYAKDAYHGYIDLEENLDSGIYYLTDGDQTVSISVLR